MVTSVGETNVEWLLHIVDTGGKCRTLVDGAHREAVTMIQNLSGRTRGTEQRQIPIHETKTGNLRSLLSVCGPAVLFSMCTRPSKKLPLQQDISGDTRQFMAS